MKQKTIKITKEESKLLNEKVNEFKKTHIAFKEAKEEYSKEWNKIADKYKIDIVKESWVFEPTTDSINEKITIDDIGGEVIVKNKITGETGKLKDMLPKRFKEKEGEVNHIVTIDADKEPMEIVISKK